MTRLIRGTRVHWNGRPHAFIELAESGLAVVLDERDQKMHVASISELKPSTEWVGKPTALVSTDTEAWATAEAILKVIAPLVRKAGNRSLPPAEVEEAGWVLDCDRATVYRYASAFRITPSVLAFVRSARSDKGSSRLDPEVDDLIQQQIGKRFLVRSRGDIAEVHEDISAECIRRGLPIPSLSTIQRRVSRIPQQVKVAKREGAKTARYRFSPILGTFPGANEPLAVYQIDHTKIDLILVDSVERRSIKRAYLTIVIDVCTRIIAGFCVSFDDPSALTTGIALGRAIATKERWLEKLQVDADWPIFGVPQKIHLDNAKEFRGKDLAWSCAKYGIQIEHRPKGAPHYGGHVERMFRTLMRRTRRIPGATFSNIRERGERDPSKDAVMTIDEYERWFATFVLKVYHNHQHKGLRKAVGYKITPLQMFELMVVGTDEHPGVGRQLPVRDEDTLRLDFLPREHKPVLRDGVQWTIKYFAEFLRQNIGVQDANQRSRKYVFARDPRDISEIYFLDETSSSYVRVPAAQLDFPSISLWEWKAARKVAGRDAPMHVVLEGQREMREQQEAAKTTTVSTRRASERRRKHGEQSTAAANRPKPAPAPVERIERVFDPFPDDDE